MSRLKNLLRNINYLTKHSLWDDKEAMIVYMTNKILDDGIYEYNLVFPGRKELQILNKEDSLSLLKNHPKSFVRTGDGEVKLMMGMDQPFQRYEHEIAERLVKLLESPREDLYVGINRDYFIPLIPQNNPEYNRRNAYDFRTFYLKHCNPLITYIDSNFTAYPLREGNLPEFKKIFDQWRALFREKDIVVVAGEGILAKLEFDVFDLANSKKVIDGPRRHAWDARNEIIARIQSEVSKEQIIVFILGMAGKAMIPELTDLGYVCWDVGHLAKYYNAYMTEMPGTAENIANFYAPD